MLNKLFVKLFVKLTLLNKEKKKFWKIIQLYEINKLLEIRGCSSGIYIKEILKIDLRVRLKDKVVQQSN